MRTKEQLAQIMQTTIIYDYGNGLRGSPQYIVPLKDQLLLEILIDIRDELTKQNLPAPVGGV